jgi:hypothetical protein
VHELGAVLVDLGTVDEVLGRDGENGSEKVFFVIGKVVQS